MKPLAGPARTRLFLVAVAALMVLAGTPTPARAADDIHDQRHMVRIGHDGTRYTALFDDMVTIHKGCQRVTIVGHSRAATGVAGLTDVTLTEIWEFTTEGVSGVTIQFGLPGINVSISQRAITWTDQGPIIGHEYGGSSGIEASVGALGQIIGVRRTLVATYKEGAIGHRLALDAEEVFCT